MWHYHTTKKYCIDFFDIFQNPADFFVRFIFLSLSEMSIIVDGSPHHTVHTLIMQMITNASKTVNIVYHTPAGLEH